MTYSELTGTQLLRSFSQLMSKVLEGIPLIIRYKGKRVKITLEQEETQGQKLVRMLGENSKNRPIDNSPYPYESNRKMYDKLLKQYD